ncbi:hypothetical protein [Streptomyces sp. NPDC048341]|uniref:hypothetical protein n=1 Tax=Streptomyces sp. NPDC048341 TaxID=3154620 RepID=UPI0034307B53
MTNAVKRLDVGTLIACCLAVAAAQLCITVPSPINGEIQSAFGASGSQVAWVTSAFILPTAILELNFGVVGDPRPRRSAVMSAFVPVGQMP